jgi:HEPN domain-containing protein
MAVPRSRDARRFYRAAARRFEEARFLLDKGDFTTAAVYLAGYAVECSLKALILVNEPTANNLTTLDSFKGTKAHSFEWLKEQLVARRVRVDAKTHQALTTVGTWTTHLRYDPQTYSRKEAEVFLKTAEEILVWTKRTI